MNYFAANCSIYEGYDNYSNAYASVERILRDKMHSIFKDQTFDACSPCHEQLLVMCKDLENIEINSTAAGYSSKASATAFMEDDNAAFPQGFPTWANMALLNGTEKYCLMFVQISQNSVVLNKVDQTYQDIREISLALQENIHHKVRVYKSENGKQYIIASSKVTTLMVRRMVALMPKLWPERAYNTELIESKAYQDAIIPFTVAGPSGSDNMTTWENLMAPLFNSLPIIEELRVKQLENALNAKTDEAIRNKQKSYDAYVADYTAAMARLSSDVTSMDTLGLELAELQGRKKKNVSDLMDYIKANRCISEVVVDGSQIILEIVTPIDYYDEEILKKYLKRTDSFIYEYNHSYPYLRQLMEDIFLNQKYQLIMRAAARIDLPNNKFNCDRDTAFSTDNASKYMRHTHIMKYNCWGNGGPKIIEALKNGDYIGAIEQIVGCCKNLNMSDSTVISSFIDELTGNPNKKYIADENGKMVSLDDLATTVYNKKEEPAEPTVAVSVDAQPFIAIPTIG